MHLFARVQETIMWRKWVVNICSTVYCFVLFCFDLFCRHFRYVIGEINYDLIPLHFHLMQLNHNFLGYKCGWELSFWYHDYGEILVALFAIIADEVLSDGRQGYNREPSYKTLNWTFIKQLGTIFLNGEWVCLPFGHDEIRTRRWFAPCVKSMTADLYR